MKISPINALPLRAPEAGRIRLGEKTEKGWPSSIDTFRFTSSHKRALDQLAALYGGTVKPWNDKKVAAGQYELKTTATSIEIMVKEDALNMQYELWTGGGCTRRCDGEMAEVPIKGPEPTLDTVPCICRRTGQADCKMKLRMNVSLPDVDFYGMWRLETSSANAAIELPGMFDMITQLSQQGQMIRAHLNLEQRTSTVDGKKKNYVVPTLSMAATPNEILAGMAQVRPQLEAASKETALELNPSQDVVEEGRPPEDDGIIEAVVIDDELADELESRVRTIAEAHGHNADMVVAKLWELTAEDPEKIQSFIDKDDGTRTLGWAQNGNLKWSKHS